MRAPTTPIRASSLLHPLHFVSQQALGERNKNRASLRLLIDSGNPDEWRKFIRTGIFYGVTTNPAILEKDGQACTLDNLRSLANEAFDLGCEEFQVQTWGRTAEEMAGVGQELALIDTRVVVKVPITKIGAEAASSLVRSNVAITMTGVYAVHQVMTAAALGATYAAPYLGRMSDAGKDGRGNCVAMQRIIDTSKSRMRLLVASIRDVEDISYLASQGCNTFTIQPKICAALFDEPLTLKAAEDFEAAARRMGAEDVD